MELKALIASYVEKIDKKSQRMDCSVLEKTSYSYNFVLFKVYFIVFVLIIANSVYTVSLIIKCLYYQ